MCLEISLFGPNYQGPSRPGRSCPTLSLPEPSCSEACCPGPSFPGCSFRGPNCNGSYGTRAILSGAELHTERIILPGPSILLYDQLQKLVGATLLQLSCPVPYGPGRYTMYMKKYLNRAELSRIELSMGGLSRF